MAIPVDNIVRESAFPPASEVPIPRISGVVPHSAAAVSQAHPLQGLHANRVGQAPPSIGDSIRAANAELERQAAQQLTIPLTLAIQQRDRVIAEASREREVWQQELARQTALFNGQLRERDAMLNLLRQQLRDAEQELANLREEPKTIIGVAPESSRVPVATAAHESAEHASLQAALEAAWQDVEDARRRLAEVEGERDRAVKEADELRVELYDKLATARDEVIDAENRLVETQRAFDDAKEQWEDEQVRLRSEVEEARQALMSQLQANVDLRQSFYPPLDPAAPNDAALRATTMQHGTALEGGTHYASANGQALVANPTETTGSGFTSMPSNGAVAPVAQPNHSDGAARSLSALVGFQTEANDEALAMAVDLDQNNGKRKGFGLGRLFRSK